MNLSDCKTHRQIGQHFKAKYKVDDKAMWDWLKKAEKYSMASVLQTALLQDLKGEFPTWDSWYCILETFKEESTPKSTEDIALWGENLKNWTSGRTTFYQYTRKALEIGQMTMADYNFAVQDRLYKRQYKYAIQHQCGFAYIENRMDL